MTEYTLAISSPVTTGTLPGDHVVSIVGGTDTYRYHWGTVNGDGTITLENKRTTTGGSHLFEYWVVYATATMSGSLESWDDTFTNPITSSVDISDDSLGVDPSPFIQVNMLQVSGYFLTTDPTSSDWNGNSLATGTWPSLDTTGDLYSGNGGSFPDPGPESPVVFLFDVSSSYDYDIVIQLGFGAPGGINLRMPDGTWRLVATDAHPLKLRMPDGSWRAYTSTGSRALKLRMPDGSWKTVGHA